MHSRENKPLNCMGLLEVDGCSEANKTNRPTLPPSSFTEPPSYIHGLVTYQKDTTGLQCTWEEPAGLRRGCCWLISLQAVISVFAGRWQDPAGEHRTLWCPAEHFTCLLVCLSSLQDNSNQGELCSELFSKSPDTAVWGIGRAMACPQHQFSDSDPELKIIQTQCIRVMPLTRGQRFLAAPWVPLALRILSPRVMGSPGPFSHGAPGFM
jgi:hypothetical protein